MLTKGDQMRILLALDQRGRRVEPDHGGVKQKISHGQVHHLRQEETKRRSGSDVFYYYYPDHHHFFFFYLLFVCSLFVDELVKDSSVFLVELLHLINVTGDLVHGLHRN